MGEVEGAEPQIPVVRAAGLAQYGWLRHGFSTRAGGVSDVYGPGALNLGWTKDDDPANVLENRRRFFAAVGADAVVGVRQVHSGTIRIIEPGDTAQLATPDGKPILEGDGLMTDVPGISLSILVADCVPVLVADPKRRAVAAFHAGWRGTRARIVEHGIQTMQQRYGSRPQHMLAVVGPSIGPCCYAVGEELRSEFKAQFSYAQELFSEVRGPNPHPAAQLHLDLWEANRRQLLDAGIPPGQITVVGECSACTTLPPDSKKKFFSHRAESGFAGRMMAVIGIQPWKAVVFRKATDLSVP